MLGTQRPGLLIGTGLERAGGQAGDGGEGHLLHLVDVDVEARPVVAEGVADDEFAPLPGELLDAFEIGGSQLPRAHG